jgi:hypothetical protein
MHRAVSLDGMLNLGLSSLYQERIFFVCCQPLVEHCGSRTQTLWRCSALHTGLFDHMLRMLHAGSVLDVLQVLHVYWYLVFDVLPP